MLKNYLMIGWRNLVSTRGFSAINVGGLATGMAVIILIGLWMADELTYNHSFTHYERLGQVYHHIALGEEKMTINDLPAPIGETIQATYPDFEQVSIATQQSKHLLAFGGKKMSDEGLFVEPAFVSMFSLEVVARSASGLSGINSIFLSESLAKSLVGDDAIGKIVKFDNRDLLMISGVFSDFPANSEFAEIKMLAPIAYYFSLGDAMRSKRTSWEDYSFQCFVLLKKKASFPRAEANIRDVLFKNASTDGKALKPEGIILPMSRWHLFNEFKDGVSAGGPVRLVWMVGTIGAFVLFLAAINFMNLSTARSEKRSKEVGIRKVMGSVHRQLVAQFLVESMLTVIISLILALIIVVLALPSFNNLAGKTISIPWTNGIFILLLVAFVFCTSLLAGSYPAFYLSSFNPVKVLKGAFRAGRFASWPRKGMVIFQFTTSVILIAGTVIVFQQIRHAKNRPVGFDREGIFHVEIRTEGLASANYNSLRHQLIETGAVDNMAISDFPITGSMSGDASITWEGKDPNLRPLIAMNSCSHDFPNTNGFQFVKGRDFSRDLASDSSAVVINEMAASVISGNIIGKKIRFGYGKEREIIGVIKDQIRWTPFMKQSPHLYYINYGNTGYLTVRLKRGSDAHEALQKVESVIRQFDDGAPFEYKFLDQDYARQFQSEERIARLAFVFAGLAICISCIGIFGLAAFASAQRTKEIGIRKVLGASVLNLWQLLSSDFIRLVLAAVLIGTPVAWYLLNDWLQQYDYRIEVSPWVFVATGIAALLITLLTVSYQTIRAALLNPVKSLRSE